MLQDIAHGLLQDGQDVLRHIAARQLTFITHDFGVPDIPVQRNAAGVQHALQPVTKANCSTVLPAGAPLV